MDEIDQILDMGVDIRYNSPVNSMKALLAEGFDAIFVGSGAPRGKDLDIPGRHDTDRIHIGIDWLESIAFGHTDSIGEKRADHRRRQHGHGLLPVLAPPGRQRYQSDGAPPARVLQSLALGTGRRRRRGRRDRDQSRAQALRDRKRQARRAWSSSAWNGTPQAKKSKVDRHRFSSRRRCDSRHRPGERVPLDRARPRHRVRQVGHAGGRRDDLAMRRAPASSSAATRPGDRRTSSGPSSTATRPPSRSTITARAFRSPSARRTA